MRKAQLLVAMIVGVLFVNGCGGTPSASQEPVPYSPGPGEEIVTAVVAPVPGSDREGLTIVTRLDERSVGATLGAEAFAVPSAQTTIAAVFDVERSFGWMAVAPVWFDAPQTTTGIAVAAEDTGVGPLSTAVAILFANPAFHHPDPEQARDIVNTLRGLPEVAAFAVELETHADGADPFDEPAVLAAFETAYHAGVDALGDSSAIETGAESERTEGGLTTQATSIAISEVDDDAVRISGDEDASTIEATWSGQYRRLTGERTVTWIGRLYEIDEEQVTRATVDRRIFDRWDANFPVRLDAPDRRLRLNAQYSEAALVIDPIGLSFDLLRAGVDFLPPPEVLKVEEGAYVSHMITCILGFAGENRSSDLTFLSEWNDLNDDVSRGDLGYACAQNILEGGIDALGVLPVNAAGVLKALADSGNDDLVNLVAELTGAALEATGSADTWSTDDYLTLLYSFVTDAATIILESGVRAGAESVGDVLLQYVNFLGRVSSAAKTGARIGTMLRVTPLERHTIVVGDPWSGVGSPPTISSFGASPSSVAEGESSTLSWSVSGDAPITLSIDNGVGDVTGTTSTVVSPAATTTYTLTASNADGSISSSTTVTVDEATVAVRAPLWSKEATYRSGMGTFTPADAAIDKAGSILVVGRNHGCDSYLAKYDQNGDELWYQQIETTCPDSDFVTVLTSVGAGPTGNIVLAGWTQGSTPASPNVGGIDAFVAQYGAFGNLDWFRHIGTEGDDLAMKVSVTAGGIILVAGTTSGALVDGAATGLGVFVRSYSSLGAELWTEQYSAGPFGWNGIPVGVAPSLGDGGWYVGWSDRIFSVASDGTQNWSLVNPFPEYGDAPDNRVYIADLEVHNDGSLAVAGTRVRPRPRNAPYTPSDFFVAKLSSDGESLWTSVFGTSSVFDQTEAVAVDGVGNSIVVGFAGGGDYRDAIVVKFDASGAPLWMGQYGLTGDNWDEFNGVATDSSGDVVVVGDSRPGSMLRYAP